MNFVFDIDGTLTPSRKPIVKEFKDFFLNFCLTHNVYLVTGSDYVKVVEQLGEEITLAVKRVYCCSGNDVYENGINIYTNTWILPERPHEWLSYNLIHSKFPLRTGLHFEHRPGMVNFSIVGRNATDEQRALYVEYDQHTKERLSLAEEFNSTFPELEAKAGGETGLDISPKGRNKSQIMKDFSEIIFFGDRMDITGNDYPLAQVNPGINHHVSGWEETYSILLDV